MPRFAANLSMLFTEVPFLDRFERAAQAAFEAAFLRLCAAAGCAARPFDGGTQWPCQPP